MGRKETAMGTSKDILLVVDYHAQNLEVRTFNGASQKKGSEAFVLARGGRGTKKGF